MTLTCGSLFSGVGMFDLGFQRAGIEVKWQVEIDEYRRKVLEKNFPDVERYSDIYDVDFKEIEDVDILCGGFPCQDFSVAGQQKGFKGVGGKLWDEYFRAICDIGPAVVVVENVEALRSEHAGRIFGQLASLGYDIEWDCIPASAFGTPHRRDRIWIVAYTSSNGLQTYRPLRFKQKQRTPERLERRIFLSEDWKTRSEGVYNDSGKFFGNGRWKSDPGTIRRVGNGNSKRLDKDRLMAIGDSLVPDIAEYIGIRIVENANCN